MKLIDHFTFDGKTTNIAPSKSHEATTGSVEGTSFTSAEMVSFAHDNTRWEYIYTKWPTKHGRKCGYVVVLF